MTSLKRSIFFCLYMWAGYCYSEDLLQGHHQLMVVTTQSWDEKKGKLCLYERVNDASPWIAVQPSIPVVIGKNGLAWGIGLHPTHSKMIYKKEGDGKSPAGLFALGKAFGFAPRSQMKRLKIDYLPLHPFIEAVDDPRSRYYNWIIDRTTVVPDWRSSEKMREEPLYAMGLFVHHNFPNPKTSAGSAIFIHIWRGQEFGTAGCTAMSEENLNHIVFWLNQNKKPVLVQLPIYEYRRLKTEWHLPPLIENSVDTSLP